MNCMTHSNFELKRANTALACMRPLAGEPPYHQQHRHSMHTPTAAQPNHTAAATEMERAHVLIRLQQQTPPPPSTSDALARKADGVTRTSATTVRLEHSDMSPGVASITFEQVYDQQHSSAYIFEQSLAPAVAKCAHGFATSLVLTGAPRSGKSFTCHGDKQQKATGMITLALRQVFKELERIQEAEPEFEYQVLLACFHVVDDQLVDLMQTPPVSVVSSTALNTEETLLQQSVLVENTAEAVHCYSQAHAKSRQATSGKSDFVTVVHVETKRPNEQVRRGRLTCIDIHGSSILEPTRWQDSASPSSENDGSVGTPGGTGKPFFSDTHFPVATGLSNWFGGFVGNESATYMLITIQKQAQYQQQAIQSLLYACKAKDIKSTSTITYVSALTNRKMMQRQQSTTNTPAAKEMEDESDSRVFSNENQTGAHESTSTPGSPVSATSSDSTGEFLVASNGTGFDRGLATTAVDYGSPNQSEKQTLLSQRLQKAYQYVKSSSLGDPLNSILVPKKKHVEVEVESGRGKHDRFEGLFATKANFLHAKADAMLKPQSHELQALSLLDKLELIHFQHQEVEKSLAQETSIKEKCVDRISKLSQTMSFQVIEHEKQMQQVLQEKERVQNQLTAMELKFEDVSKEIEQLQQQVHAMKMSREEAQISAALLASPSLVSSDSSERVLLQQFSSRLEATMEEAKGVVDFKDGVIQELERRLEESAQANARFSKELARQKLSHEQEKVDLLNEISDLKSVVQRHEEATARDATRVVEQRSELMATISHLTSEIKAFDTKWAAREQEHAQAFVQAQQDCLNNEGADDAENQSRLEELLTKKTRECVASQAANAASRRNAQLLQARVEEIAYKMERKKKKMEKKMKALMSDRKLHKTASSRQALDLARQVEDSQIKEEQMHREIADLHEELHQHESNEVALRAEVEQLQCTSSKLEKRILELQEQLGALEAVNHTLKDQHQSAEAKFQRQIYEMEESLVRRLLEREAHLASEHERKLKKMMDRHPAELLQRDVHDEYTPCSASSLISTVSDSEMFHQQQQQQQHSIDQLDALIDSKERQYARSRDTTPRSDRKKPSSGRQEQKLAVLKKKLSELTQALAVANEQETLAKAQAQKIIDAHQESLSQRDHLLEEMNRLKKENWSLSLALQVTERRRQ